MKMVRPFRQLFQRWSRKESAVSDTRMTMVAEPEVTEILLGEDVRERDVVSVAAGLLLNVGHPLTSPVLQAATDRVARIAVIDDVELLSGEGIQGHCAGAHVILGSEDVIRGCGITIPERDINRITVHRHDSTAVLVLAKNGSYFGALVVCEKR